MPKHTEDCGSNKVMYGQLRNYNCDCGADKNTCPQCGTGKEGKDAYCDKCWSEYLGTHIGGRGDDFNDRD